MVVMNESFSGRPSYQHGSYAAKRTTTYCTNHTPERSLQPATTAQGVNSEQWRRGTKKCLVIAGSLALESSSRRIASTRAESFAVPNSSSHMQFSSEPPPEDFLFLLGTGRLSKRDGIP